MRIYTNAAELSVYHTTDDYTGPEDWVAECKHGEAEMFELKRDAMLAFGAQFCEYCRIDDAPVGVLLDVPTTESYVEPVQGLCRCGCPEPVARGRLYRPGHDARHAGAVARALIEDPSDRAAEVVRAAMSGALRAKVDKIRRSHR